MMRFFLLFLLLGSPAFSQGAKNSKTPPAVSTTQSADSVASNENSKSPSDSPKVNTPPPELPNPALQAYFDQNADTSTTATASPGSYTANLPSAWGPFFFLLVLIILIYILIRWVKYRVQNFKMSENPVDFIRTLATIPITSQIQMVLVDIGGRYYLMGASSHSLELLMEITDPDLVFKIQSIPLSGTPRRFSEVVASLLGIRTPKKISPVKSEEKLKKFIETQKDRIGKM